MAKKNKQRSKKKSLRPTQRKSMLPDNTLARALRHHKAGDLLKAEGCYRKILTRDPHHPDALHLRGVIKSQQGDYASAVKLIQQAIQQYPNNENFYINLGNALAHQGRLDEALETYHLALKINPNHFEALHNMGNLLKRARRFPEAIQYFQRALKLNSDKAEVYNDLGNVLIEMRQVEDAMTCYRKALALKPDYPEACNNMGTALKVLERYSDACQCYHLAIQKDPFYAEAFNNLGATIAAMDKPDEAIKFFRKALELRPDYDLALVDLYYALKRTCAWGDLEALDVKLDASVDKALQNGLQIVEDPFLSLARHDDPAVNYTVAKSWSDGISATMGRLEANFRFDDRNASDHKITIGYLSKNFRNHAMAHLMAGMFEHHDRSRFKVYAYSSGEDDNSDYRKRIEKGCDKFVDIREYHHLEAARAIYNDKVDILVDLMGYTRGNRMEIAALHPAPVQVRYMGMAGTTGADFFDYLIADQTVIPVVQSRYYSEKLAYMPDCYQVNDQRQAIADVIFDRRDLGLPAGGFVFCSFNQLFKLDAVMFNVWMRILKEVPESVLWLQAGSRVAEDNLFSSAEACGVERRRIVFGRKMSKAEHLARLRAADLALDTRLVSGAATTSDALWAGIPVVTLAGNHFSSRMSTSVLKAVGLPELIADSLAAYQNLAVRIARDPDWRQALRQKLTDNRETTQLFNTQGFTAHLETAYAKMWQTYLEGRAPERIEVYE